MERGPEVPDTSRMYKDGMFRVLFKKRKNFLSLCGATKGVSYGRDTVMKDMTLRSALYTKQKNDVAFLINGTIFVFVEHQSTLNPNLPARFLSFVWQSYRSLYTPQQINGPRALIYPRPELEVFYNGVAPAPERAILRLSDLYAPPGPGDENPPMLDLFVRIYNINSGNNPELLDRCQPLREYQTFVELVREYEKTYSRHKAVDLAVDECMKRGILAEFFKIYGSEVKYMLYTEQYEAKLRGVWEDYGMERGMERGREEGIGIGMEKGLKKGLKKGQEEERRKIVSLLKKGVSTDELMKILAARR